MTTADERIEELHAKIDGLAERIEHLTELVEAGGGAGPADPGISPDDDLWRRLGLTEGERRTVTVVFSDVSGFTALSSKLNDPEAMQLVIRDTMSLLAECVQAEGGTVEKFIGDAVSAIFGAPVAHSDEPERAARASLAMHKALAERAASRPELPPLMVHIGINTGPVIAGTVGDGSQFGVMGDTINMAARIMDIAKNGQTFVSAATARRLRRGFQLEDAGVHEVKGKPEPLAVMSLIDQLSVAEQEGQRRLRAPLVGRDDELASLRNLARRSADGDGVVVLVVGEPGTGVSRLAGEVAGELGDSGWRVLRASARVQAETPLGLVATALAPLVEGAAAGDAKEVAEALLTGGAAPHDFELALGGFVVEASERQPLLVVLDDVDNADPGSMEVVRYLSHVTADKPVLWLLTGERVPPVFDPVLGTADAVQVRIGPLTEDAIEALFEALLPGALSLAQRDRLAHLAEGNAQFATEIAHALVDDGVVAEAEHGRWVLLGDADNIALPGSVAELIEARIDQLPTQARITLQDAAVIGQRFSGSLLRRVATIPMSLDAALAELSDAELVLPPPQGDMWSFRSRLVREVAYDSLLKRRRPTAHRAVADALLELEPDRVAENADLLAHHLEEGDDPPAALPHLFVAVDRAEFAYNFTGALDRARRALKLRDRFPGRVETDVAAALLQRVGTLKVILGDPSGLGELQAAADLLTEAGSPAAVASLQERVAWYLVIDGHREAAVPYLQAAQAIAESELDDDARTGVLAAIATTRAFGVAAAGDLRTGLAAVEGAAAEARSAGDPFVEARALLVGGVCRLWAGNASEAAIELRACMELSWTNLFPSLADRCGRWLVQALVDAGRFAEAIELAEPLLARSDDRGDPSVGCGVRVGLADLRRQLGRQRDEAWNLATIAVKTADERHVAADAAADAHLLLARLALDAVTIGRGLVPADADAVAVAAAEIQSHLAAVEQVAIDAEWLNWRWAARAAILRGRLALARGDLDGAVAAAGETRIALGIAPARRELIAADRLEGEALAARGVEASVALLRAALDGAEEIGSPFLVGSTAAVMARALADLDPAAAAEASVLAAGADEVGQALARGQYRPGPMKLMVVSAISRESSTCYILAEKLAELASAHGVQVDFTHPANAALPIQDGTVAFDDARSLAWQERLGAIHAHLWVSPEYHSGMTGGMKNLFDHCPKEPLRGDVVGLFALAGGAMAALNTLNNMSVVARSLGAWVAPEYCAANSEEVKAGMDERMVARLDRIVATVIDTARRLQPEAEGEAEGIPF